MRALVRRIAVAVVGLTCLAALGAANLFAQEPQVPEPPGQFFELDKLPPAEQMAAAPLLVAAYSVVLIVLFLYVLSVARRLSAVQREVDRLEADVKRTSRA